MAKFLIVTEKRSDWASYFPSDSVVTVADYLDHRRDPQARNVQVINLCRSYAYQSLGYYCSLLGEARGHRVLPSLRTINAVGQRELQSVLLEGLSQALDQTFAGLELRQVSLRLYFGQTEQPSLQKLASQLFEQFPLPVMDVSLRHTRQGWLLTGIKPYPFHKLTDPEQDRFASALERFSSKIWRQPSPNRSYRYDLAMLVDRNEAFPPSNPLAIKRFIRAGKRLGMNVELINQDQLGRLGEYDALFIRATTNIDNFTYRFARRAEKLGLVVIDDPESIMHCTNKVYLEELLASHRVPTPKTRILRAGEHHWAERVEEALGLPCILKVPDGSFSRGVMKVASREELEQKARELMKESALILAQEYMYTDYDWRIGVLNRQPLYACKYYMSKGHWQIYQHGENGQYSAGDWETLDVQSVPRCVRDTALKAANLVKQVGNKAYVIEINDNPSLDHDIEDRFLGDLLYEKVMLEFLRRLQQRGL